MNRDLIRKAESAAKSSLNTRSSYRYIDCLVYEDESPSRINVNITYSGTNSYGGRVENDIYCEFDIKTRELIRTIGP